MFIGKVGNSILYVKMKNTLYGYKMESLFLYDNMLKDLKNMGFVLNLYDQCVTNKIFRGQQFTITWHLDDLKMSCTYDNEITEVVK